MEFKLSELQEAEANKWIKEKIKSPSFPQSTIGGAFTYEFTPTGICIFISIRCVDGDRLDLTEYDKI